MEIKFQSQIRIGKVDLICPHFASHKPRLSLTKHENSVFLSDVPTNLILSKIKYILFFSPFDTV